MPQTMLVALGLLALLGSGCQLKCERNLDCPNDQFCNFGLGRCSQECFTDLDCTDPPECHGATDVCVPKGLFCSPRGRCLKDPTDNREDKERDRVIITGSEGWDDPPGTGLIYVVRRLEIADAHEGFDLDRSRFGEGGVNNLLSALNAPSLGLNQTLNQAVLSGQSMILFEVVGLDDPYTGDDQSVTLKIYSGRDADDPPNPANNFRHVAGRPTCCEFVVDPVNYELDLNNQPQAKVRVAAQIQGGRLVTRQPADFNLTLGVGDRPPYPSLQMGLVHVFAELPASKQEMHSGIFGGAVKANALAQITNPFCSVAIGPICPKTLLGMIRATANSEPDIDLDGDGQECVIVDPQTGAIGQCCDGAGQGSVCLPGGTSCEGPVIAPPVADQPHTCATRPEMVDGYSLALRFEAIRATLKDAAPRP